LAFLGKTRNFLYGSSPRATLFTSDGTLDFLELTDPRKINMRLTLRTLLAYLDHTLEPQDAELLRTKISESAFATQLVERIQTSLVNTHLSAPAPDAVAPVEDANVICEYLDSTLSAEQVAEIERACLESETHLAEAAACHQILTMVLGQPADVSPSLRQRIYELPDRELSDIASSANFSSLAIPGTPAAGGFAGDLPPAEFANAASNQDAIYSDDVDTVVPPLPPLEAGSREAVVPVGPADSGVSDAPTRLRQAGTIGPGEAPPVVAGSDSPRLLRRSDMYGGSIRPSRITPWLVSLALAAVLLFALAQSFSPLLRSRTAGTVGDIDDRADVIVPIESSTPDSDSAVLPDASTDALPPPSDGQPRTTESRSATDATPIPKSESQTPEKSNETATTPLAGDADESDATGTTHGDMAASTPTTESTTAPPLPTPPSPSSLSINSSETDPGETEDSEPGMSEVVEGAPPEETEQTPQVSPKPRGKPAVVLSEETLLVGRIDQGPWTRLHKEMQIGPGVTIVCAPHFQGHLASEIGVDLMLVGATEISWESSQAPPATTVGVNYGRLLIGSQQSGATLGLRLGETRMKVTFDEPEAVIAITRSHFRAPGFDPLLPENHLATTSILAVQGTTRITRDGQENALSTGDQWSQRGTADPDIGTVETLPAWIENPDADSEEVYALARGALLELVAGDAPILKSLREATNFRRSEVAALAGRTLLALGVANIYFGGDGLLSRTDQRNYWPEHYRDLVRVVDRDPQAAEQLFEAVASMESADAAVLSRLLVGYSQKQLAAGGDAKLVDLLDANSMAVRVLAIENLRAITGISLNYRAEQENALRRAPEIKKWGVRLRKEDIRW